MANIRIDREEVEEVFEIKMPTISKLEGVIIFLTGLDVNSFERFRDEVKYVFGL